MADKAQDLFVPILFQGRFHLGEQLFIGIMHDVDTLLGTIRRAEPASLAQGFDHFGLFLFVHPDRSVGTPLPADTAAVAVCQINIRDNAFGLYVPVLHRDGDPHGRTDSLFAGLLQGLGVLGTAAQGDAVRRKIQGSQFDVAFLKKSLLIGRHLEQAFHRFHGLIPLESDGKHQEVGGQGKLPSEQ